MEEKKTYYTCVPNSDGSYKMKEKLLYRKWKNCFLTKKEAITHFKNAERIALEKYNKIVIGINKLKEELGDFSYDCEVKVLDDSGLETTIYIEIVVDGYHFKFSQ